MGSLDAARAQLAERGSAMLEDALRAAGLLRLGLEKIPGLRVIRPEDVDIVPEEKGMLKGTVTSVTFLGVHYEIIVDINGFKWMIQTTDFVDVDERIGIYLEPDAIHIMKKSEYSGMFGDYSSFSNEFDELSDAEAAAEAEEEE